MYRAARVKEFELAFKQSGQLLRKPLVALCESNRKAEIINFKYLFRDPVRRDPME